MAVSSFPHALVEFGCVPEYEGELIPETRALGDDRISVDVMVAELQVSDAARYFFKKQNIFKQQTYLSLPHTLQFPYNVDLVNKV